MCRGRLWGRATLFIRAPLGNLEGGSYTGDFERWRALGMGHRSSREIYEGNLEGGLLYWGPWRMCKGRLWKWASVSIEAPLLGNMERRSFPTAFERREKFNYLGKFLRGI
jgi:hypothetical protein